MQGHRLLRFLNRHKVVILMYHGFTDRVRQEGIEDHNDKQLNIEKFRAQLDYLTRHYSILSLDRLVRHLKEGTRPPAHSVVITIDDGYESNYTLAYPLLSRYGSPAAIFLTTDFVDGKTPLWVDRVESAIRLTRAPELSLDIDGERIFYRLDGSASRIACDKALRSLLKRMPPRKREDIVARVEDQLGRQHPDARSMLPLYRPLNWDQIREMARSGIVSIGGHTCSHPILTRCGPEEMEREIALSKILIEENTGRPCVLFCYPNGAAGDFDRRTRNLLQSAGYSCALTTVSGFTDAESDLFELKRFGVANTISLPEFAMLVAGVSVARSHLSRLISRLTMPRRSLHA